MQWHLRGVRRHLAGTGKGLAPAGRGLDAPSRCLQKANDTIAQSGGRLFDLRKRRTPGARFLGALRQPRNDRREARAAPERSIAIAS